MSCQLAAALFLVFLLPLPAEEKVDLQTIHRIRTEAFEQSKVMDHLFYLTDVYGPRLSGTPAFKRAADWTVQRLTESGISNARLEKWGPYGRGWSYSRFSVAQIEPVYSPIIGFPMAFVSGTNGPAHGEVLAASIRLEPDFEKYRGKLRGKIVLIDPLQDLQPQDRPQQARFTDAQLAEFAMAPDGTAAPARNQPTRAGMPGIAPGEPFDMAKVRAFLDKRNKFLVEEGALAVLTVGTRNDGGTIFATSGGSYDPKRATPPPMIAISAEQYNRMMRLRQKGIGVQVQLELAAEFFDGDPYAYNVIGEIPGTTKADEIVMIGAHLDSWHGATGATDNAAGSAIMIEVMRILKALDLRMDRTVRIGLWSGEEEGLLGSKAYVKAHFADPKDMMLKPEHSKLAAYFNIDNGTGKIRGVYIQGNDMVRPIFESWLAPFQDLGATTVSIRKTGGTDHLSFDAVGLPGFQFIQDPVEYQTRTHHSNMDVYDRIVAGDLKQMTAIVASFVYDAAIRQEMLPRKPLPKPGNPAPAKPAVSGN